MWNLLTNQNTTANDFAIDCANHGCIQAKNSSVQMLWVPQKNVPKNEDQKKMLLSDKFLK